MIGHPEYHKEFDLENHYYFELQPCLLGQGQIVAIRGPELPDAGDCDIIWMYESLAQATLAMINWHARGFEGEPQGWARSQPPAYRRRSPWGSAEDEVLTE